MRDKEDGAMREISSKEKRLNELSFDDVYLEETDETYPAVNQAFGGQKTKYQKRKSYYTNTGIPEIEALNLTARGSYANYMRQTEFRRMS